MGTKKVTKEKIEELHKIPYFKIYRYATWSERLATVIGVLLGLLSGGGICFILVQIGELSTSFIERTSYQSQYTSYLPLTIAFGGGVRLRNGSNEEQMAALMDDAKSMAIGTFVSVIISLLLVISSVALINWSALRQITRIRKIFLEAVMRQDMTWFDTDTEFNLATKMTEDMMKIKDGIGEKLAIVSNLLGTAVICISLTFPLGWELALACLSVVPFSIAASVILSNYQNKSSVRELNAYSQAGKQAEEVLKSVRTIVAFGGENREVERYKKLLEPAERYGRKRGLYTGLGTGFNWVLTYSLNAIGLSYGTRLVLHDLLIPNPDDRRYAVGEIFSILFSMYMATQSITFCVPHAESFSGARAAAASVFALIERKPKINSMSKEGALPRRVIGDIAFEDVCFNYPSRPDVKVLKEFSLHIKAGECVALVGSSGCGKSTILQLLQRMYDVHSGSVKIDGRDLRTLNIGVVGQEPVLFRGTIHDNIAIGYQHATREEVIKAATMAYAHDFIVNLQQGYDTVIGERGALLSGGQKQRIAIARSLLLEPAVLILDEATSALDPHSEKQVQTALDSASVGRTTIVVSHRLSTIVNADRIICMDQGAIVESGTHEELMKAKAYASRLVPSLSKSTSDDGNHEELTEFVKHSRETYRDFSIFGNKSSISIQKVAFGEQELMKKNTDGDLKLLVFHAFYHKLVTTGQEVKEPDMIDTLTEEVDGEGDTEEAPTLAPRVDVKRKSNRKVHRHHSIKKETHDWMTPRGSISSVISTGLQNFVYNTDIVESDEEVETDEKIPPVSDWKLIKLNAPEWPYLVVGALAAFTQGACFPAFACLFGFTSGIFANEDHDHDKIRQQADFYSGMFIVVAAVAGISMCLQSITFTNAGLKMTSRLRHQYFSSLLKQEIAYFDKESNTVGSLCSRLTGDAAAVQGATGLRIGLILQGLSSVVVGFIMAISYNWKLTLVGSVFLPLMVGSIWLEGIVSQKSQENETEALESATTVATEAILSIKTVQSLGVESKFINKFNKALSESAVAVARKSRWRGLVLGLGIYVPFLSYCCATVYGATLVANENVPYTIVFLVTEALMYGAYMLGQSLVYAPSFNAAKACGARVLAVINRESKVVTAHGLKHKKDWRSTGQFSFKEVEFSYPTRPHLRVLRGLDLQVESGKTVALVGASGCGKSTVLQLLQRFYDPDSGTIELDGRDIRNQLTLPQLRKQLGVVQQEPVLFDRTLGENIAYGDNSRKVTTMEIVAAAKAANIHSFIISLPKGYDTNLGSSGAQLSGGQKQRVCIARALIRSPRLLLLDEATSALDANSERAVSEALEKAAKGRTCITIAHRLSTIKDANLICVVEKGKIVEKGTHAELVTLKGQYWRMCKGQHVALN